MTPAIVFLIVRLALAALLLAMLVMILRELRRGLRPAPGVGAEAPLVCLVPEPAQEDQPSFVLAGMNTIGRAPGNTILLDHASVSSYHARLAFAAGNWLLEDLGSRNGTRVNGVELHEPLAVTLGDRLQFGGIGFRLLAQGQDRLRAPGDSPPAGPPLTQDAADRTAVPAKPDEGGARDG